MNYNAKRDYNRKLNEGGIGYNSIHYTKNVYLSERMSISESNPTIKAAYFIGDTFSAYDTPHVFAFMSKEDIFEVLDPEIKVSLLIKAEESISIDDGKVNLSVLIEPIEKISLIEKEKIWAAVVKNETIGGYDLYDIRAYLRANDSFYGTDKVSPLAFITKHDSIGAADKEPRTAVSDFLIGHIDQADTAFDWFYPLNLMVDWRGSSIQYVPQAESNYIEMQGVDGAIPENTVYKNRMFNIVGYTVDGLSILEKEELKKQIARVLDATKHETKKLTFQAAGIAFDVKYSGLADVQDGPSFVKVTVPLEGSPYAYPLFDNIVYGSGLIINDGHDDVGVVNIISEGAVNPSFKMGEITYTWKGTVPRSNKLIIDHEAYMCYLESAGKKTNAITQLTGDFQRIPKESSVIIECYGNTAQYLTTTIKERLVW